MPPSASESRAQEAPRYCPRCDRAARVPGELCRDCGEVLRPQSYCSVCERFWRLPGGADCPKHDLALETGPIEPDTERTGPVRWVTIARYNHPSQAEAPRLRLDAEGIPSFLDGARMSGHSLQGFTGGGLSLQVPDELAAEARILLSQTWSLPMEMEDDLDDAWEELGPEPGARRRTIMKIVIVLMLVLPALWELLLVALSWLS